MRAAGPDPVVTEAEAAKAARETGSPVEVLGLRGETREVYAQPDGGFVAVEHLRPIRTLKDGQWVDIDTTLRKEPDGSIRPAATTVDLRLSGGGTAMMSLRRAGRELTLTWPTALPEPELDGDTAVYRSVLGPDVDLRVRATAEGASHVLVVKTPEAALDPRLAELRFGMSAPGLRVSRDARGNQSVADQVTGCSGRRPRRCGTRADRPMRHYNVLAQDAAVADAARPRPQEHGEVGHRTARPHSPAVRT